MYDPTAPEITPGSMCTKIFVRGYAEPTKQRSHEWKPRPKERPPSWFDGRFCIIDTETVEHELTFGAFEFYDRRKLVTRAVFYRDDLPTRNPASFTELQRICRERHLPLYSLAYVFTSYIWKWRSSGGTFTFFNAPYDLSRLATNWKPATKGERRGAFFMNGFAFTRTFETTKDEHGVPMLDADGKLLHRTVEQTFVRIKRDDRHHVRYDMGAAHVLDLATLAFALTDETHSLESACKAFGIEFDERPGEHSGAITPKNVHGCRYDAQKTSELLYALGREYDRHPIHLPPWHAQSGASLARAYLRAFGVAPRSTVQPDFPKAYQGYAATAYLGGRVEARIVHEPVPCAYIDAVSMYPSVFSLLDLWFAHVVPAKLEPEEIDPEHVQTLLDELHADPKRLLDPKVWPQLAFFALVDPNGAMLPTRPEITPPFLTLRALLAQESERIYEERLAQNVFWSALDECGGKIIPDMLFDRKSRRWRMAGEFADLPRALIRANSKRSQSGRVYGNIDKIAQHVRDALGDSTATTSGVLDFFKTHARPSKQGARRIARDELTPEAIAENASRRLVSIGSVESRVPLWFAGPDLAAAAISGSGRPHVVHAWRLRAEGLQETLRPVRFRGEDEIDPGVADPFRRLIELRKRKSGDVLDDDLRSTGYKVIANSGAYGIFVETTPEDIDPDAPREERPVRVWGLYEFESRVDRPERHSALCFFPTAALVTAGARLMLALGERLVHDEGGEVAYCDTDSLVIAANERGGLMPCTNGPYRMPDGTRSVRALSWEQVDRILDDLAALNVYDRSAVPGSSFKLEDENFDEQGKRRELWFYGMREKSYALYALDASGEPVVVKHSAHTIGLYSSPIPGDREQRWIAQAWAFTIRKALGLSVEPPAWLNLPALSQLTLTTANSMKHYAKTSKPFDFLAVTQVAYPGMLDCCDAPRPSCPLFPDIHQWAKQPWRCLGCGAPIDPFLADSEQSAFKTYERVVAQLALSAELKRLLADGSEPTRKNARGLTIPRPVRIDSIDVIEHMGKEVIVDPSDTEEGLTPELLGETRPLPYRSEARRLDVLRDRTKAFGISRAARRSKVSRSAVQAFVNQRTRSHRSTIERLEAALNSSDSP